MTTETTLTSTQDTEQQTDNAELIVVFQSRAATYGFLSRLFRKEIDEEFLQELHATHYRVSTGNANVDEGHRLIATYLSGIWENTVTELAADYMRVFYGHGYNGHAAAYPFESVHTSEKRLMMQDARDEVLALYRAAGLDKQDSWKEGEDHIALELEFMQILSERTVEALTQGDMDAAVSLIKRQNGFLEDHLSAWVPFLAGEMVRFAKTDFYRGLAYLVQGFVEEDALLIQELLADEE